MLTLYSTDTEECLSALILLVKHRQSTTPMQFCFTVCWPVSLSSKLVLYLCNAGLATASNQFMQDEMSDKAQKELLMEYSDQLRLSMAANLQDYHMENFKV